MRFLSILLSEHRELLMGLLAFGLWAFSCFWYFRRDIQRIRRENRSHTWSVDMEAKTGTGGRASKH